MVFAEEVDSQSDSVAADVVDVVVNHRHVLTQSGHVELVTEKVAREHWSEKHPKCANCW